MGNFGCTQLSQAHWQQMKWMPSCTLYLHLVENGIKRQGNRILEDLRWEVGLEYDEDAEDDG